MNYYGMLLQVIIILSLRNVLVYLNQINHWNKPTQYKKQIKQHNFFFSRFLKFFYAIAPNTSPLNYVTESKEEARVDGAYLRGSQKMYPTESVYSREALEEIKNLYIKEEDFFHGNK